MDLFKYLSPERTDVVQHARLRFTQAAALNDPFELRPFFEELIPKNELEQGVRERIDLEPHLSDAYQMVPEAMRRGITMEQFREFARLALASPQGVQALDDAVRFALGIAESTTPQLRESILEHIGSRIGILSLSDTATDTLMWAHYAGEHRGFVARFDGSHEFFDRRRSTDDEFLHLRPVSYRAPRSFGSMMELTGNDVFFAKSEQWAYEREYRVVAPLALADVTLTASGMQVSLFSFPRAALTGIVFGARSPESLRRSLYELVESEPGYSHVQLFEAQIDAKSASIRVQPISKEADGNDARKLSAT